MVGPREPSLAAYSSTSLRDADFLKGIAAIALHDAEEWKFSATAKAAESWAQSVKRHLENGAGLAHRLVKGGDIKPFDVTTFGIGPNITAKASDILEDDLAQWRTVWTRLGSAPTAP